MMRDQADFDVVIIGAGLAGLTLALQLRQAHGNLRLALIERNALPVPLAAHKVGESSVEIGARYFAKHVGLEAHLEAEQLRKFGLRFFFNSDQVTDLADAVELGGRAYLKEPSYQLDRGLLENHMAERAGNEGIEIIDAATVLKVEFGERNHRVDYRKADRRHALRARWVVDAASRGSVTKRQPGLGEDNGHAVNAAWFRLDAKLNVDDFSDRAEFHQRIINGVSRYYSTNHLMGEGYWVWLIPLSSGATSVGIVVDPAFHGFGEVKDFDSALQWLQRFQPQCGSAVGDLRGELMDYRRLRHFSHGCKQVFSPQRWALTGEAGVFLDPFYSPGSDFIAISNTLIGKLIELDLAGKRFAGQAQLLESVYLSFYESTLLLYRDQYGAFGDAAVMTYKTIWDYAYYWAVLALLFYQRRIDDAHLLGRHAAALKQAKQLNARLQLAFRQTAQRAPGRDLRGVYIDQLDMPYMVRLNAELGDDLSVDGLDARLRRNFADLEQLAKQTLAALAGDDLKAAATGLLQGVPLPIAQSLMTNVQARRTVA